MKTLQQVTKEREEVLSQMANLSTTDKDRKMYGRLQKEANFLKICILYLKTEPTRQYLESCRHKLNNRIKLLVDAMPKYPPGANPKAVSKAKQEYRKLVGLNDAQLKLKTVVFLLSQQRELSNA